MSSYTIKSAGHQSVSAPVTAPSETLLREFKYFLYGLFLFFFLVFKYSELLNEEIIDYIRADIFRSSSQEHYTQATGSEVPSIPN